MLSMSARQRRATIPLSSKSFDAFGICRSTDNRNPMMGGEEGAAAILLLPNPPPRRGSFLYRSSDSDNELSPMCLSRKLSATVDQQAEGLLVTPFAQVLQSLRTVRENYIALANISPSQTRRQSENTSSAPPENVTPKKEPQPLPSDDQFSKMVEETLSELEWCLEQLETIQTHKSVADMATSKFKRMLNRELNQFSDSSKSGNEISEFIFSTFVDKQDFQLPTVNIEGPENEDQRSLASQRGDSANDVTAQPEGDVGSSGDVIPAYGIEVESQDQLIEIMGTVDLWGIDAFKLNDVSCGKPLTVTAFTVLKQRDVMRLLKIPAKTLVTYLSSVEENYNQANPYHNSIHAADVTQSSHYLLRLTSLQDIFTELELIATVIASAVHDVDHPGVTNQFIIDSGMELAVMYNDLSVLENHHLAVAFTLLREPGANIFEQLPVTSYQTLRRMIIDIVLATDMSTHMSLLADLKTMVETQKITRCGILHLDNYSDRLQVLKTLVHCSDLSNPTKPLPLYRQWTDRIMEEFFRQGDLERNNGLEISPMCDRNTASVEKSQIGFIDYIVHPLWEAWGELVYPDCHDILDTLEANRDWFQAKITASFPGNQDNVLKEEPNEDDEEEEEEEEGQEKRHSTEDKQETNTGAI